MRKQTLTPEQALTLLRGETTPRRTRTTRAPTRAKPKLSCASKLALAFVLGMPAGAWLYLHHDRVWLALHILVSGGAS